jgi:hypothetical protein
MNKHYSEQEEAGQAWSRRTQDGQRNDENRATRGDQGRDRSRWDEQWRFGSDEQSRGSGDYERGASGDDRSRYGSSESSRGQSGNRSQSSGAGEWSQSGGNRGRESGGGQGIGGQYSGEQFDWNGGRGQRSSENFGGSGNYGGNRGLTQGNLGTGEWGHGDGQLFGQGYASGSLGSRQREGQGFGPSSGRGRGFAGRGPKGYQRSDERIKEQISDRLMDDDDIDASEITVEVAGGEVTLTGTVGSRHEKRAAEEAVEQMPGVREVQNHLRVKTSGDASSGESGQSGNGGSTSGSSASTKSKKAERE